MCIVTKNSTITYNSTIHLYDKYDNAYNNIYSSQSTSHHILSIQYTRVLYFSIQYRYK
jgi:hypothetical protein